MRSCIFVGSIIGGYIGWFIGDYIGLTTALLLSGVGSLVGIYYGWKFGARFMWVAAGWADAATIAQAVRA